VSDPLVFVRSLKFPFFPLVITRLLSFPQFGPIWAAKCFVILFPYPPQGQVPRSFHTHLFPNATPFNGFFVSKFCRLTPTPFCIVSARVHCAFRKGIHLCTHLPIPPPQNFGFSFAFFFFPPHRRRSNGRGPDLGLPLMEPNSCNLHSRVLRISPTPIWRNAGSGDQAPSLLFFQLINILIPHPLRGVPLLSPLCLESPFILVYSASIQGPHEDSSFGSLTSFLRPELSRFLVEQLSPWPWVRISTVGIVSGLFFFRGLSNISSRPRYNLRLNTSVVRGSLFWSPSPFLF